MSKFKLTQTATEVQDILNNSLQKPTGLTKTELVGVGVNGQENIEIGDNLTLANGKLSAATGGGGSLPSTIEFDKDGNRNVKKNLKVDGNIENSRLATDKNKDGLQASISWYDILFFNKLKDMKQPIAYDLEYVNKVSDNISYLRCGKWAFHETSLTDRNQVSSSTNVFCITKKVFTHGVVLTSGNDIVSCTLITAGYGLNGDDNTERGNPLDMRTFKQVRKERRYSANGVIGGKQIVYIQGESETVLAYGTDGTSHDLSNFNISDITYVLHYGH